MPIYEEKNKVNGQKRYYISTYVKGIDGKSKKITRRNKNWIGRNGYFLAQQEEIRLKNNLVEEQKNITINELLDNKLNADKQYLKRSSIIRYEGFIQKYLKPFFMNKRIFEISTRDIVDWQAWLQTQNISIDSMKKIHNLLSSSLDFGMRCYGLEKNVARAIGNFKNKRGVVKKDIQFLTLNEFKEFIKQERSELYKDFFTILFFTGMRRGELLAITKKDLDFENRLIKINKSINPKNGKEATVPKTNKANRTIPMLEEAYNVLYKYRNIDVLFDLDIIKPSTLTRKCHENCLKANINKEIRIHDLRHSFVALCIESGVQIEKISEYVGHENITTTYNVYSHLYPNSKSELITKVDGFINKQYQ